jgi:diguanylate cyclase (GGDEF)-like protein
MRIRTIALLLLAGIGVVTLSGVAVLYDQQRSRLARLDEARALVQVIGHVSRFVEAMALERGAYNQLLVSSEVHPGEVEALISPRVMMTDDVFRDTETALSALPSKLRELIGASIRKARSQVRIGRAELDSGLAQSSSSERVATTTTLLSRFLAAGGFIDEALLKAEREVTDREPRVGLIIKNPRVANEMREAAGQRSTILSRFAGTGIRLDDDAIEKVSELTGAVHLSWDRLRRLSRQPGNAPKLDEAIANIESTFVKEGEPIYAQMAEAARQGSSPPMDLLAWRTWTVKMLTNILTARDAPIAQALEDLENLRTVTERNVRLTISGTSCFFLILAAVGFTLERRILKPIELLTEKLDLDRSQADATDDQDVIAKYSSRRDEIGALARALDGRRRYEKEIEHLARHDVLTNLPNRALFRDELKRAFANRSREGERVAVLCLDLDRFKPVNDSLGHAVGDELLQQVAMRLSSCVRAGDLAARLGGDEFGVIQSRVEDEGDASALAERIVQSLSVPYDLAGHRVTIGASVGIAIGAGADGTPDELVHQADLALYRVKAEGRQSFSFYHQDMDARAETRRKLEMDLQEAVEKHQFEVHFQPIIRLNDDIVTGFEALLRWRHPDRGMISPVEFIPIAEDTGLINQIGQWVLMEACKQAAAWPPHISVAVNLSPIQFKQVTLPLQVASALSRSGLEPSRLELEITEAVLLKDTESTQRTLRQLREIGVRIALDDFGTGYSSLSYLSRFHFDKIKIDRSFISGMSAQTDALSIVRAISALGADLGMTVTAEGVETEEQLAHLRTVCCTEVQGFLFSRPKAARDLDEFLSGTKLSGAAGGSCAFETPDDITQWTKTG